MSRREYEAIPREDDEPTRAVAIDGLGIRGNGFFTSGASGGDGAGNGDGGGGGGPSRRGGPGPGEKPAPTTLPSSKRAQEPKHQRHATARWRDLPRKQQLLVITATRLSEPLVQTSLQAYMFYQLKWFDPSLPDSVVARQAGVLHASFTAAQFLTAMMWGRIADSSRVGRKTVIMIGLVGTLVSCVGFGFSTSFWMALCFRLLGGATNGNVGVLRTMISEIIREKKYQSRAFLLLPMTFNIGVIIGPILGGMLSDPAGSYPDLFGRVGFFLRFPYALPNMVSAVFLLAAAVAVWLFLEETHDALRDKPDLGAALGVRLKAWLGRCCCRRRTRRGGEGGSDIAYTRLLAEGDEEAEDAPDSSSLAMSPLSPRSEAGPFQPLAPPPPPSSSSPGSAPKPPTTKSKSTGPSRPRYTQRLPFRRIFTRNVVATLVAHFMLAWHLGTYNTLWFVFLSTPAFDPATRNPAPNLPPSYRTRLPFVFTGGLGLPPPKIGLAMALLGTLGIVAQLFLYPAVAARLGTVRSWRLALACCFPLVYALAPYLAVVPSATPPPAPKDGALVWLALLAVLAIHVLGRTFALPAQTILVNNCTPHPSVLGTVHGLGQSVSSFARTVGPIVGAAVYGEGLSRGVVGAVWWGMLATVAVAGAVESQWVREGDGHEIWLEGDWEEGMEGDDAGEGGGREGETGREELLRRQLDEEEQGGSNGVGGDGQQGNTGRLARA